MKASLTAQDLGFPEGWYLKEPLWGNKLVCCKTPRSTWQLYSPDGLVAGPGLADGTLQVHSGFVEIATKRFARAGLFLLEKIYEAPCEDEGFHTYWTWRFEAPAHDS